MQMSIVIPVRNAEKSIGRTLSSLTEQTSKSFEVIVVDGGSTDGTAGVIAEYKPSNTRVVVDARPGITVAVNTGIRLATGDVVMPWLCADDYLDKDFVRATLATFAASHCDFVYGNWHAVQDGKILKSRTPDFQWREKIRYYMPRILSDTFVFKRELLQRLGALDETLRFANDYDLIRRATDAGAVGVYCPDAWYFYQTGGASQARHYECAREVVRSAIGHGSGRILTNLLFLSRYLQVKASFMLNTLRANL